MDIAEMSARAGAADLLATYQFLVDSGKVRQAADLFTPDGVFESDTGEFTGPLGVLEFFRTTKDAFIAADFLPARHYLSSVRVEPSAPGRVSAYSCFQYIGTRGLDHWGTYRDEIVEVDGAWKFARRRATVEGYVVGSPVIPILGLSQARTRS